MPRAPGGGPSRRREKPEPPLDRPSELGELMLQSKDASEFLKALSHESRLRMACLLAERERSVTELETLLSLRQPTVSQQLARLREQGLIEPRRQGKAIYYRLTSDEVRQLLALLCKMFHKDRKGTSEDTV
ncbi:MAG: metalloregulator ArsR/SmtB family transcription factor [Rhodomicrobiaceae bacterium]